MLLTWVLQVMRRAATGLVTLMVSGVGGQPEVGAAGGVALGVCGLCRVS